VLPHYLRKNKWESLVNLNKSCNSGLTNHQQWQIWREDNITRRITYNHYKYSQRFHISKTYSIEHHNNYRVVGKRSAILQVLRENAKNFLTDHTRNIQFKKQAQTTYRGNQIRVIMFRVFCKINLKVQNYDRVDDRVSISVSKNHVTLCVILPSCCSWKPCTSRRPQRQIWRPQHLLLGTAGISSVN